MKIWVCKDGDGRTRLTNVKPIWNEEYQTWINDARSTQYQSWLAISANCTNLNRGDVAEVAGITCQNRESPKK